MSQSPNKPYYSRNPIYSLAALSKALGFEEAFLVELATTANDRYRLAKPITKPDGSIRQPFDALEPLKEVHRRLKKEIFSKVVFPQYLTGSLKGRDYRVNASLHTDAKIVICEDIEAFFPSTDSSLVMGIWQNFFGFSQDVAELLTKLTTKDGALPQGAITSSFLANLAFWRAEPVLHFQLLEQGIIYSRYVDDITVSSRLRLEKEDKTKAIAAIYGMLRQSGYSAKRRKHEITTNGHRMFTTKLLINKKPSLKAEERANIRAAVFQLEQKIGQGLRGPAIISELNRVAGLVGKLSLFHVAQGRALKKRIMDLRKNLNINNVPQT